VPPRELSFPRFRSPNLSLIVLLFPPPPSLCHCIFYSRFNLILFSIAAISACETVLLAARGEEVALFGSLSLKREREKEETRDSARRTRDYSFLTEGPLWTSRDEIEVDVIVIAAATAAAILQDTPLPRTCLSGFLRLGGDPGYC